MVYGILSMGSAGPPDAVLDHVDTVDNGVEYEPVTLSFQVTNNGGYGSVYMHWTLYDSGDTEVDSGSEEFFMDPGTDTYTFSSLSYPAAGTGYYYSVQTTTGTPQDSNNFDVTT